MRQTSFTRRHPDQTTLTDEDADRPEDCMCSGSELEAEGGLPCFPCYRLGFENPNPDAGSDD